MSAADSTFVASVLLFYVFLFGVIIVDGGGKQAYSKKLNIQRNDYSVLPLLMNSQKLSYLLSNLSDELGIAFLQQVMQSLPFTEVNFSAVQEVEQLAKRLDDKLNHCIGTLHATSKEVEQLFVKAPYDSMIFTQYVECCSLDLKFLEYDSHFNAAVNTSFSCDIVPPVLPPPYSFHATKNLTDVFQRSRQLNKDIKWQYFMSSEGVHVEYPAHRFDPEDFGQCTSLERHRHKDVYLKTVLPHRKAAVILIDQGNILSDAQLQTAKTLANSLLHALSESDLVTVLRIASDVASPAFAGCIDPNLLPMSPDVKQRLSSFIDGLQMPQKEDCRGKNFDMSRPCGGTNHTAGFERSFDVLRSLGQTRDAQPYILYISRGILTSIKDAGWVLRTIAKRNAEMDNAVLIHTFAMLDYRKELMFETTFLQDIAHQNFSKHSDAKEVVLDSRLTSVPPRGQMFMINNSDEAVLSVRKLLQCFSLPDSKLQVINSSADSAPVHLSLPQWDESARSIMLSSSRVVQYTNFHAKNQVVGIVGVDLDLLDLLDPIVYYVPSLPDSYAFLIDLSGNTIVHPKFGLHKSRAPTSVDIRLIENNFEDVCSTMLKADNVNGTATVSFESGHITYVWKRLSQAPYIVVIATPVETITRWKLSVDLKAYDYPRVVHHRLDVLPQEGVCVQFQQLATREHATLFLPARCFQRPSQYLKYNTFTDERFSAQNHMIYLTDGLRLLSNPGLKDDVRPDVVAIASMATHWKTQALKSKYAPYILRKYVAVTHGVMLVYPGTLLDKRYDPTARSWYRNAVDFPELLILSAPYLDPSGAGYTVTISQSFQEKRVAATTSAKGAIVGVLGMDVPMAFLYKLLVDTLPSCAEPTMRCFLFDQDGYVVAYPDVVQDAQPVELNHLTFREPALINDLLSRQPDTFLRKVVCNQYSDGTLQRMYRFNLSWSEVVRNEPQGEQCLKYQITRVERTNLFLAVVNQTCERMRSFCPCSRTDRWCLNCGGSSGAQECECPCECMLHTDVCRVSERPMQKFASCSRPQAPLLVPQLPKDTRSLPDCIPSSCSDCRTESSCMGRVWFEWCRSEQTSATDATPTQPLGDRAYCGLVSECFGGVKGASPYARRVEILSGDETLVQSTPIGPVAGGIIAIFIVLVIGVYCYRHQVVRFIEGNNAYANCEDAEATDRANVLDDSGGGAAENDFLDDSHANNLLLASFERENSHALGAFQRRHLRRGPHTESSDDHGYSTMTPANDETSDRGTVIEPLTVQVRSTKGSANPSASPVRGGDSGHSPIVVVYMPKLATDAQIAAVNDSVPQQDADLCVPGQTVLPADNTGAVAAQAHIVQVQ